MCVPKNAGKIENINLSLKTTKLIFFGLLKKRTGRKVSIFVTICVVTLSRIARHCKRLLNIRKNAYAQTKPDHFDHLSLWL